ncbi:hypothetical protein ACHAXA_004606 [Cyclostephanos tholiformis]|uniref:Uncharacterized protein n=1 Tax=Cyclostephanos tholiformis TaxID=382380 RepID=A0ABD3SPZ3_9STRA
MRVSSILSILLLAAPSVTSAANVQRRRVVKIYKTDDGDSKRALQPDQGMEGPEDAMAGPEDAVGGPPVEGEDSSLSSSLSMSLSMSTSSEAADIITPTNAPSMVDVGGPPEMTGAPSAVAVESDMSMSMSSSMSASMSTSMSYELDVPISRTMSPVSSASATTPTLPPVSMPTLPPIGEPVGTPEDPDGDGDVHTEDVEIVVTGMPSPAPTVAKIVEPAAATSGATAVGNGLAALAAVAAFLA